MLGYVHLQHPTMILPIPFFIYNGNNCNVCNVCNLMQAYCFQFYFLLVTVIIFVKMVPGLRWLFEGAEASATWSAMLRRPQLCHGVP